MEGKDRLSEEMRRRENNNEGGREEESESGREMGERWNEIGMC